MPDRPLDQLHGHATWGPVLRPEFVEDGRLHRHQYKDRRAVPRFTSWAHNGPNHSHKLPDGAWTRPRNSFRDGLTPEEARRTLDDDGRRAAS